jgi:hypothetical protein
VSVVGMQVRLTVCQRSFVFRQAHLHALESSVLGNCGVWRLSQSTVWRQAGLVENGMACVTAANPADQHQPLSKSMSV